MGKSRRSTHKRLEEMKRLALLDPDLILDEDAILMLQPTRRKYTRRPKYDLPPDDRHMTTDISEVIEIKQGAGPGRKRQKKQEDIFDSNDCNDSNEPTPEEIKEQKASVERKRKVDLKYQWYNVLKTLCTSYLIFVGKQGGLPSTEIDSPVAFDCQCSEKVLLTKTVRMYFFHAIKDVSVCYCSCKPLAEALMLMGMFPSSPSSPKSAIHLGLLGFFNEVRNTLKSSSEGIAKLYNNLRGNPVQSCLSANICRNVLYMYNRLLLAADKEVNQRTGLKDLAMCCPACPSRDSNHPMDRIFITMDGCFSMKCKSKASLLDELFTIDTVENAWVKPESVELYKKEKPPKDALLNENSFRAAGNGASYKSKLYPVKGIFTASCARHDLTLKMVDMDSGEGFKYPLSVLHELFQEDKDSIKTPVNLMYDIICVLEKSLTTHFPYLTANGTLALPVFHAYAHVISCQSSFNPKNIESYGRTDGEASERLWSSLRPFVTITRPMSQANRRLTLTLAIRHRNMEKKWGMASVLYGKYKSTKKILAAGLVKLKGVNQEEISLAWERHLALTRSGKSCSKIWSDLPPSLGSVTRFYLLESILFRFRVKMYENSTGTSNAAIDRLDGVLTVSASDGSIKVAGETFFMQQIKDIEKKQEKVLDEIRQTIPNFVPHAYADLSAETAQLSLGLWEDFIQRKKLLFKDAMRANLQAYKFTTNLMFKSGHIGTKLAGQHGKALGKQRKLLDDLLDIYNQEFQEGITAATFLDGNSPFWGIDLHPKTEPWLCVRNANEELKLLKREAHNLFSNIEVEIEELTRAKRWAAEDFERTGVAEEKGISEGVKTLLERQLEQSNKWKSHSMRYLVLLGVSPPINFASEPQSDTANLLDPTVDFEGDDVVEDEEDLVLVSEGEEEDEDDGEEDMEESESREENENQ